VLTGKVRIDLLLLKTVDFGRTISMRVVTDAGGDRCRW
jgi:hypothetical protein